MPQAVSGYNKGCGCEGWERGGWREGRVERGEEQLWRPNAGDAKRVLLGGEGALTPLTPNHSCVGVDLSLLLKVNLATVC